MKLNVVPALRSSLVQTLVIQYETRTCEAETVASSLIENAWCRPFKQGQRRKEARTGRGRGGGGTARRNPVNASAEPRLKKL